MLPALNLTMMAFSLLATLIIYALYSLLLKPLYLIKQYTKQGAHREYYPLLGGLGKRDKEVVSTGDFLHFYKKTIQDEKSNVRLFATNIASNVLLFLADPALIKEFILKQEENYVKAGEFIDIHKYLLGNGLFSSEGKTWKKHRKIVSNVFHFEFLKNMIPTIVQTTQEALDNISKEDLTEIDVMEEYQKITAQITGRIFFGQEFANTLINGKSFPKAIVDLECQFAEEQVGIWTNLFGLWFLEAQILPRHRKLFRNIREVRQLCMSFVEKKKQERANHKEEESKNQSKTLLEILLDHQEKSQDQFLTDDEIVDEFLTFFLAGTDTTGHVLTMTTYYLTQHPTSYQKVLEEAQEIILNEGKDLTYEDVDKMKYTLGVLKESLRLGNPAFMPVPRQAVKDHYLKDIKITKGTRVNFFTGLNCIKEEYFDNPNEFKPERWLPENEESMKWKKEPYSYIPFSSGARNCIGQHLALLEARIILGMFLKRFEMKVPEGYQMKLAIRFLYEPLDPFKLQLKVKS